MMFGCSEIHREVSDQPLTPQWTEGILVFGWWEKGQPQELPPSQASNHDETLLPRMPGALGADGSEQPGLALASSN